MKPGAGASTRNVNPMARRFARDLAPCVAAVLLLAAGTAAADGTVPAVAPGMFPAGSEFQPLLLVLTDDQIDVVRDRADVRVKPKLMQAWRVRTNGAFGGHFFVDRVIGKHEFITYGVGVDPAGHVIGLEILEYLESYGGEVERPDWRAQFYGKSLANSLLDFGEDIDGISGATLSARNITDGVRKLLILLDEVPDLPLARPR